VRDAQEMLMRDAQEMMRDAWVKHERLRETREIMRFMRYSEIRSERCIGDDDDERCMEFDGRCMRD
jgi:hypothetical protein